MKFAIDELIHFDEEEEDTPYTIKAINERFAILTRPFEDTVYYTIVDSETWMRGPNNLVFNMYDYTKNEDIRRCMIDLESGACELSRRNSIPVLLTEDSVNDFDTQRA